MGWNDDFDPESDFDDFGQFYPDWWESDDYIWNDESDDPSPKVNWDPYWDIPPEEEAQ